MDNGEMPAFPLPASVGKIKRCGPLDGLTKREYFAGLAMQGLLAGDKDLMTNPERTAELAVEYAEALLLDLEVTKPDE